MRITVFLVLLSLLATAGRTAAQEQQHAARDAEAWRALAGALEPGAFVSVRSKDGTRVHGTLVQQAPDGLLLKPKTRLPSPMRSIAYSEIDEIERQKPGMNAGLKVLLGTGIGAGVMLLVGAIIVAAASS